MKNPFYQNLTDTLDDWVNHPATTSKGLINCLVQWISEDPSWLIENISQVDKEILKEIVGRMK